MYTKRRERSNFKSIIILMISFLFLSCFLGNTAIGYEKIPDRIVIARDNVDYPPMEFHEDGKLTGLHVEMVNEVAASMGISIEWKQVPWRRALNMVKAGEADGITYIGKTPEREGWAIFLDDNILSEATFSFMINKDDKDKILFSGNVEEFLKDRPLLTIAGFTLPEEIEKSKAKIYEAPRIDNLVDMILAKMYDVALVNKDDFLNIYRDTDTGSSVLFLEPPVSSYQNYVAFSKEKSLECLADKFAQEFASFKSTQKYIDLKQKFSQ